MQQLSGQGEYTMQKKENFLKLQTCAKLIE